MRMQVQFVEMVPVIGTTLIVATLLVKNWRIYYIFHRKTLMTEVSHACIDYYLVMCDMTHYLSHVTY